MSAVNRVNELVDAKSAGFTALADRVWGYAEIRFSETRSAADQESALKAEGFRVTSGVAGLPTAFVAEAGSGGPVIAILGEYDALAGLSQVAGSAEKQAEVPDGNGHGCGHNLLGAAALAAAVAVKDYLAAEGIAGTVRYYGCPAEEGGSGKTYMVRDGLFDDVDAALTWHPGTITHVMTCSSLANIQAYFRFTGRASHAAASPELGRSALDAVELMNVGVNYMREHMPQEARVHYAVTNTGGISPNVVQAEAEVLYLIRAPEMSVVEELFARVRKIAEGAALMTETEVAMTLDRATSSLLPNGVLERTLQESLTELEAVPFDAADEAFGRDLRRTLSVQDIAASFKMADQEVDESAVMVGKVLPLSQTRGLLSGSTDVGDVSRVVPTAQFWGACYTVGTPFHSWQLVAQGKSPAAHKGMIFAAKALAGAAIKLLHSPQTVAAAKAELAHRMRGKPYHSPVPADVKPRMDLDGKGGVLLPRGIEAPRA
jgi:aminobenzoyl-glutamate utilization protein B